MQVPAVEPWPTRALSSDSNVPVLVIRDGCVQESNTAARRLLGDACAPGASVDALFGAGASECLGTLIRSGPSAAPLVTTGPSLECRFHVLPTEGGAILVADRAAARTADVIQPKGDPETERAGVAQPTPASSVSEALAELSRMDVTAVLQAFALQARAVTQADYVALGIGTDPARSFDPWVYVGMPSAAVDALGRHPRPVGLLGAVARGGQTVRCADIRTDPRRAGLPAHHPEMASFVGVPIRHGARSVGNIYVANKPGGREFSEVDEQVMCMLATSAGVAIDAAVSYVAERRRGEWLHNVIDQMPIGVLVYDERCQLRAVNQACKALRCEMKLTDQYGNASFALEHPGGAVLEPDEHPVARAFERNETVVGEELELVDAEGRKIPVIVSALPVRTASGQCCGVTTTIENISDRRRQERMRNEWSAMIAHDVRQPVSALAMAADLLMQLHAADPTDRERKLIERVRRASSQLARMIEDLSDASLLESKRLSLHRDRVDMGALVESIVESPGAPAIRARLDVALEAWVDEDRIRQVLANLLSNAEKYGSPGAPIELTVSSHDDEIEVVVTNEGPGIPSDRLPLVFDRFERGCETGTPGLGLGLYITKGIVEAHGGRVWAESTPGQTTSFHVVLPKHGDDRVVH